MLCECLESCSVTVPSTFYDRKNQWFFGFHVRRRWGELLSIREKTKSKQHVSEFVSSSFSDVTSLAFPPSDVTSLLLSLFFFSLMRFECRLSPLSSFSRLEHLATAISMTCFGRVRIAER